MIEKVINTIEKYNMIVKGDKIVVGLSGGPDSTALLHILFSLRELYDIQLFAVHINHMIRGEEALRDEEFAKRFAESLNIRFFLKRVDVVKFAKDNKMSSEEAGRFVRYEFFNEIADKVNAGKIAIAHNMNDQAETIIMRFLRGSGISGLCGIQPVREGKYIRPIIECSREEIEEYCRINKLNPVTDSSNKENIFARNRIRLEVIPYIKKYFNQNIVESICRISEIVRDEDEYMDREALFKLNSIKKRDGYEIEKFSRLHNAIKRRIIRHIVEEIKGNLNSIETKHIEECIKIIQQKETGKRIYLPDGIECAVEYDIFKIKKKLEKKEYEFEINIPGKVSLFEQGIDIYAEVMDNNNKRYNDSRFVKYFDYDKISGRLTVRTRRNGDFMYPKGMQGRKKIKDIFIDYKIPRDVRDRLPLIALGSEILWIPEIRDTANYKINENTQHILEIKIKRSDSFEPGNKADNPD